MMRSVLALVAVLAIPVGAFAQSQEYRTMKGEKVGTNRKELWEVVEKRDGRGGYSQCRWVALDKAGKVINSQLVVYFPNAPEKDEDGKLNTDRSHYWVYWCKVNEVKQDDKTVVQLIGWGRCPTPKHPDYAAMQKDAKGLDLWQLIPEDQRKPEGSLRVRDLGPKFGPTISTEDKKLPKIAKGQEQTITCIDFTNPMFN